MRAIPYLPIAASLCLFAGCAEFPETYENVIADGNIRPFAIVLDPPEAAPGDTVQAALKLYDAGKAYTVRWSLALKFQIKQGVTGSSFPTASEWVELDSGSLVTGSASDGLSLGFVIPDGERNPLRLSSYVPSLFPESDLSAEEKSLLQGLGIESTAGGIPRDTLLAALASRRSLPNGLAPLVDGFLAVLQIKAHVASPGFSVMVTKNLTVRYSNRLAAGAHLSNVNANPRLDSLGFIRVQAAGVTDFDEIREHASDTVFFAASRGEEAARAFDTLKIEPGFSYFLIASGATGQAYRSPEGLRHEEQLAYQWFYTDLDAPGMAGSELIGIKKGGRPLDGPVVPIRVPAPGKSHRRFAIRATLGDSRPEWGLLSSPGLAYASLYCVFAYP